MLFFFFTKKNKDGKPRLNVNALFEITLKSKEHVFYLWENTYKSLCSSTPPNPWPSSKSGKAATQYHFGSRSLASLTELHHKWYVWSDEMQKFIKIVPSDIYDSLTPIGLAHWIMGDGYWDKSSKTLFICTDNFSYNEVINLIKVLEKKFSLKSTVNRRTKANKILCWRIRFSGTYENISLLRTLVQIHMIPSMQYKLNL